VVECGENVAFVEMRLVGLDARREVGGQAWIHNQGSRVKGLKGECEILSVCG
jgi:hypothetical protein